MIDANLVATPASSDSFAGGREAGGVCRSCPLCGAGGGSELARSEPWRLIACDGCGLAYLPEVPPPAAIENDFDWHASFRRERLQRWLRTPLARVWTGLLGLIKPDRDRRALRRIRRWTPPGRLLDIGAGTGRLAAYVLRAGFDPVCVELSPGMAARAAERVGAARVYRGRLQDFEFKRESFDVAVAISYLEHEPEPRRLLRRVHGLLRPGGVLIAKVPNFDSWLRRLRGRRWSGYRWPEHVQYFTPATLAALFERNGFAVSTCRAHALSDNLWMSARRR